MARSFVEQLAQSETYQRKPMQTARSSISPLPYTSSAFENHARRDIPAHLVESAKPLAPRNMSLAWDETEAFGISSDMRHTSGPLSEQERKIALYEQYVSNVWISSCIDIISKRITSGGWEIEPTVQGKGNKKNRELLKTFFTHINQDEDCLQLLRSIIIDLLIYGEAYVEILRKNGKPFQLHKIDCQTINFQLSPHGEVTGYTQTLQNAQPVTFQPEEVIRWWLPSPRASKLALSPIERIMTPLYMHQSMAAWANMFFKKGARPPFWIEMGENAGEREASRYMQWMRENYTGQNNAHIPMVLYNGMKLHEVGRGSVDMDFQKGRGIARDEILAGYGVPLSMIGIQETAHLGGGTGDSADRSLRFNTCDPIKQLILEKLNYRVIYLSDGGFGIADYIMSTRYGDYRSEDSVSTIYDREIRNGSSTINEVRQANGRMPVPGGDTSVIVASRDIVAVETLDTLADTSQQNSDLDIETKKAQIDKIKQPPPQPIVQHVLPGQEDPSKTVPPAQGDEGSHGK